MDAPLYPPAVAYVAPAVLPHQLDTKYTSIKELLASPEARKILLEEIPGFEARINNQMLKPHLGNFSPQSLAQFGVFSAAMLDRVDVRLRALPATTAINGSAGQ